MLDLPNLIYSSDLGDVAIIHKSFSSIEKLKKELYKCWYHYEISLSNCENLNLQKYKNKKFKYMESEYLNLWNKKNKKTKEITPGKISYIENIMLNLVESPENFLLPVTRLTMYPDFDTIFIYKTLQEGNIVLSKKHHDLITTITNPSL